MAKHVTRDRKLSPEEAANYRQLRAEIESEKPEILDAAQQARAKVRRQQLASVMKELKAAREAKVAEFMRSMSTATAETVLHAITKSLMSCACRRRAHARA